MKNFQIIKINEDSSIKVEYLKTDYTDIPNPDGLKGEDLFVHITNIISEFQRESDFLNPEPNVLETLEINTGVNSMSSDFETVTSDIENIKEDLVIGTGATTVAATITQVSKDY
jgi:hypothetical protein